MVECKNQEKRTETVEGVFQGLRVTGHVFGNAISKDLNLGDLNLQDISVEIRKILPNGEKQEIYIGDYLRLFKHFTVIQNRTHNDFIHNTALVATNTVVGSKYEYFVPLSLKFPCPIAGKFECVLQVKNAFGTTNCDLTQSKISLEFDTSDEPAEFDFQVIVKSLNSGQSTFAEALGDGICDITITGYATTSSAYTESTKNFNKVTLSSTHQSWSADFKQIVNRCLMEQVDFMDSFPTNFARYNGRDLILHTGEILGNTRLNVDLIASNIIGEDSICYTQLKPLADSDVRQVGMYIDKKNKLSFGRV